MRYSQDRYKRRNKTPMDRTGVTKMAERLSAAVIVIVFLVLIYLFLTGG